MVKKLTAKSIRQGQTVYVITHGENYDDGYSVVRIRLLKPKTSKTLINYMTESGKVFYSRRKAIRKAKELNRMMEM